MIDVITQAKLARINTLARKKKESGLTKKEQAEQKALREEYLGNMRSSFENQLKGIKVVDPEGTDVTPEKVKKLRSENKDN